jgi:hypothetical protein
MAKEEEAEVVDKDQRVVLDKGLFLEIARLRIDTR